MSDTVKLIIEIPEEIYIHFLSRYKYQDTNDIGLSECEKVGVAIKNGTPLDNVKAEIDAQYDGVRPYNIDVAEGLDMAFRIIDKYKG